MRAKGMAEGKGTNRSEKHGSREQGAGGAKPGPGAAPEPGAERPVPADGAAMVPPPAPRERARPQGSVQPARVRCQAALPPTSRSAAVLAQAASPLHTVARARGSAYLKDVAPPPRHSVVTSLTTQRAGPVRPAHSSSSAGNCGSELAGARWPEGCRPLVVLESPPPCWG